MRTATSPPPEMPSTSTLPSSSCIACILDCSCAACFIMPRKSAIHGSFRIAESSSLSERSAGSSPPASASGGSAASLRTSTTLAPGNRASTSCTRGSASAARSRSFSMTSFCDRSVGCPASLDTITVQRRPVHCSSLRERSLTSMRAALRSSATSSRPSSMRTRRTSASSAALVMRSRFSPASATSCGKLVIRSAGADCTSGAAAMACGRADMPQRNAWSGNDGARRR